MVLNVTQCRSYGNQAASFADRMFPLFQHFHSSVQHEMENCLCSSYPSSKRHNWPLIMTESRHAGQWHFEHLPNNWVLWYSTTSANSNISHFSWGYRPTDCEIVSMQWTNVPRLQTDMLSLTPSHFAMPHNSYARVSRPISGAWQKWTNEWREYPSTIINLSVTSPATGDLATFEPNEQDKITHVCIRPIPVIMDCHTS